MSAPRPARPPAPRHPRLLPAACALALTALSGLALAQTAAPPPAPPTSPPATTPAPPAADDEAARARLEAARAHFDKGVRFQGESNWAAAVAEYTESIALVPRRATIKNAAICLQRLLRHDEALEMFQRLRDLPDLPDADMLLALHSIERLDRLLGTLEIVHGPPGAKIVVDGRERGALPLSEPLRVTAGTHLVRVHKDGHFPLERRLDIAPGAVKRLTAELSALTSFGRLKVVEAAGRKVQVIVDNLVVGETPWQGMLDLGAHAVWLRGPGQLASAPTSTWVKRDRATTLTLAAQPLRGWLRVEPSPVGATVLIDSVEVGRGLWEGRLPEGPHRVDVLAEGFPYKTRTILLEGDARQILAVRLEPGEGPEEPDHADPAEPPAWTRHLRLTATAAFAAALPLPRHLGPPCRARCQTSSLAGAAAILGAAYQLHPAFQLGPSAGFLALAARSTETGAGLLTPVGKPPPPYSGTVQDTYTLAGALLGASFAARRDAPFPITARLGAGVLAGALIDDRTASLVDSAGRPYPTGPARQAPSLTYLYLSAETRAGLPLTDNLDIEATLQAFFFGALQRPAWDPTRPVFAGTDGLGTYPAAPLLPQQFMLLSPGLGATYRF